MDYKICGKCEENKEVSLFYKEISKQDGLRSVCKSCENKRRRAYEFSSTFGITVEDYDLMLQQQNNRCYICEKKYLNGRSLAVDHCHTTGEIRGLLCFKCNSAIGQLDDDLERLQRAIEYIKYSKTGMFVPRNIR